MYEGSVVNSPFYECNEIFFDDSQFILIKAMALLLI